MPQFREIAEGRQKQGADESIVYTLTTTNWGSTPTSPSVKVYNASTDADVTSTVMPTNSPSVSGDVITLSPLESLTDGTNYRVEITFTSGGSTFVAKAIVEGEE